MAMLKNQRVYEHFSRVNPRARSCEILRGYNPRFLVRWRWLGATFSGLCLPRSDDGRMKFWKAAKYGERQGDHQWYYIDRHIIHACISSIGTYVHVCMDPYVHEYMNKWIWLNTYILVQTYIHQHIYSWWFHTRILVLFFRNLGHRHPVEYSFWIVLAPPATEWRGWTSPWINPFSSASWCSLDVA